MQASEGHTHSHQTRNIPLDIVWWIYPMHHGPVLGRRAKHTQLQGRRREDGEGVAG